MESEKIHYKNYVNTLEIIKYIKVGKRKIEVILQQNKLDIIIDINKKVNKTFKKQGTINLKYTSNHKSFLRTCRQEG